MFQTVAIATALLRAKLLELEELCCMPAKA